MIELTIREMVSCPDMRGAFIEVTRCNTCPHFEKSRWGKVFCKYEESARKEGKLLVKHTLKLNEDEDDDEDF